MTVTIMHGDCLAMLPTLPAESVDAVVTDPPYGLEFMGKEWDRLWTDKKPSKPEGHTGSDGVRRSKASPMSANLAQPSYRGGMAAQKFHEAWAREVFRVMKPGAHLVAFGGTRTFHRLTCAIEDAGFEIRDCLMWLYGSGFPKSLDVGKALDKMAGAEREVVGPRRLPDGRPVTAVNHEGNHKRYDGYHRPWRDDPEAVARNQSETAPATDLARQWDGWGTALKPSFEPIILARKPLRGSVAANVARYSTGALNIDGCRIRTADDLNGGAYSGGKRNAILGDTRTATAAGMYGEDGRLSPNEYRQPSGRWPPNVCLSHIPPDEHGEGGCEAVGVKRVRNHGHGPAARGIGGISTSGHAGQTDLVERREPTETVTAWECAPGCPIALLDAQSGERPTGAIKPYEYGGGSSPASLFHSKRVTSTHESSTGTASRFFPTFPPDDNDVVVFGAPHRVVRVTGKKVGERRGEPLIAEDGSDEATRFKYVAKADAAERRLPDGSRVSHPTQKPLTLMSWLVKLVTPPNGTVLDPFAGSGTTLIAADRLGFDAIGIEQDATYVAEARDRVAGDSPLFANVEVV